MEMQEKGGECPEYLIIIDFEATCDEGERPKVTRQTQEIIEFPWVVLETATGRIVHQEQHFVQPRLRVDGDKILTPFCTQLTGITEDKLRDAPFLEDVMKLFDLYLEETFISAGKSFAIVTDGEWDLKQMLVLETTRKGIARANHYNEFVNLKEEFALVCSSSSTSLKRMLKELGLKLEGRHHSGLDDCLNIANIAVQLIARGSKFGTRVRVEADYDPATDTNIKDFNHDRVPTVIAGEGGKMGSVKETDTVVLRGLPYSATEGDVIEFFKGLKIKRGGVHLVNNEAGKPSGICYVQFKSTGDGRKSLAFHNKRMGSRYVEIFVSSADRIPPASSCQKGGVPPNGKGGRGGRGGGRGGIKPGDWICPSCGDHQFASRARCRMCNAARPH